MKKNSRFQTIAVLLGFIMVLYVLPSSPVTHAYAKGDRESFQQQGDIQGDITDKVQSIKADHNNPPNEIDSNLIDRDNQTKWLSFNNTAKITMKLFEPEAVNKYAFTSANDYQGRDPQNWILYGSNDGDSWTKLDTQNGVHFKDRHQRKIFKFKNETKYTYYRFDITKNAGENDTQLAEIAISNGKVNESKPIDAKVGKSGKTVELKFRKDINTLPENAKDHLHLMRGDEKSFKGANLKNSDPSTIVLHLKLPITEKRSNVRVVYDGDAGISFTDGNNLKKFNTFVMNGSEYLISSPWAKKVSKKNPHSKYPRPQMKRDMWKNLNGTWQFEEQRKDKRFRRVNN